MTKEPGPHESVAAPTLHEELADILLAAGNEWMSVAALATEVNVRDRYHKRDRSLVEPSQVHLRTRTGGGYEDLFERNGRLVRVRRASGAIAASRQRQPAPVARRPVPDASSGTVEPLVALDGPRLGIDDAEGRVPRERGLYAIYGDRSTWLILGLGPPPDDRPLYVGKAEDSLLARDLGQHFADGKTGSSTVRRSVAALLRDEFQLRGLPRNPAKPNHFDRFALSPTDERKLTEWMRSHLTIATWAAPADIQLATTEAQVIRRLIPPLNLTHVTTPWTVGLRGKRAIMASDARGWAMGGMGSDE